MSNNAVVEEGRKGRFKGLCAGIENRDYCSGTGGGTEGGTSGGGLQNKADELNNSFMMIVEERVEEGVSIIRSVMRIRAVLNCLVTRRDCRW